MVLTALINVFEKCIGECWRTIFVCVCQRLFYYKATDHRNMKSNVKIEIKDYLV